MYSAEFKSDAVLAALAKLEADMGDMSDVMNELGEELLESTKQRFADGVAPDGTPWAPKSQTTLDTYKRRKQTVDTRPLHGPNASGIALRNSIFHTYGPDHLELGTNAIQAAVMQFGAEAGAFGENAIKKPIPWGNIPARPFLGLSETDEENILSLVAEYLKPASE